jgi:GTP-binding protein HflX
VSALTGQGIDELMDTIGQMLPRPPVRVAVTLPYSRGDLINEAHREGEVLSEDHAGDGYRLVADVSDALAARIHEAASAAS